jgi:hypothetical protein
MSKPSIVHPTFLLLTSLLALFPCRAGTVSDNTWICGVFAGRSPAPEKVAESDARRRACAVADKTPDTFVLTGAGDSMSPLYAHGTVLVCQRIGYDELSRGMTVLFRDQSRRVVAHVLVAKARDGWRATGLNNPRHDMEPVVAANFLGVVIAAFTPVNPPTSVGAAADRTAE